MTDLHKACAEGVVSAIREKLAGVDAGTLSYIAERGARIDASCQGRDVRTANVSGNVFDAAVSSTIHYLHGADGKPATATSVDRAYRERVKRETGLTVKLDSATSGSLVKVRMGAHDDGQCVQRAQKAINAAHDRIQARAEFQARIARMPQETAADRKRIRSLVRLAKRDGLI
jgi:hypothetical protein